MLFLQRHPVLAACLLLLKSLAIMRTPEPHWAITLSNLAALIGMVLGTAGFVMSLMSYPRGIGRE